MTLPKESEYACDLLANNFCSALRRVNWGDGINILKCPLGNVLMTKRIVVTGVSQGLGNAMVRGFIDRGHTRLSVVLVMQQAISSLQNEYP